MSSKSAVLFTTIFQTVIKAKEKLKWIPDIAVVFRLFNRDLIARVWNTHFIIFFFSVQDLFPEEIF